MSNRREADNWGLGCLVVGVLAVATVAASFLYVESTSSTQADERSKCQEALKLGIEQNTPGPGWEVVLKIPGKEHVPQQLCTDPQLDREKKQVICLNDVSGVGSTVRENLTRTVSGESPDGPEVVKLLEWSTR